MANYSGEDTKLQIGVESAWGDGVAPTVELDMISEEFGEDMAIATEPSLVGKATEGRSDVMGKKVPGGFTILVKPNNIGELLACALGSETGVSAVGSGVYDHAFSLITGSASTLPFFTAVVDKKVGAKGYVSNKINSLVFECPNNDYLTAKVATIGRAEQADALESLTLSTLRAFNFNDITVEIDDSPVAYVLSINSISINNNLEDDLFVADGSEYMIEIDRQRRQVTVEMEVLWNDDLDTLRDAVYKAAEPAKVEIIFTGATAAGAYSYSLHFTLANAYLTADPIGKIGGPERMRTTLSWRAAAIGSDQPLVVTLRNMTSTDYL